MELSMDETMNLIEKMKEKIALIKGLYGRMIMGIAARKIYGKEEIRSKGSYVWDLDMQPCLNHTGSKQRARFLRKVFL